MRRAPTIRLSREEREQLLRLAGSGGTDSRIARRARIVLRAATGAENRQIARGLGTGAGTVSLWRRRFRMQRVPGILRDAPRPGRPPQVPTSTIRLILRRTLGRGAPGGRRWTARRLASSVGVSKTTVERIWRSHQIAPRRAVPAPSPGADTPFVENVTDLVGLYLNPPERGMAFSVDARRRRSPIGPKERAALGELRERRRTEEFRSFLQAVDRETPRELDVHLLLDHHISSAALEVQRWLVRHPRFHLHFLPAPGTGPNVIDRWFAGFTRKRTPPETYPGVVRLHRAIRDHYSRPEAASRPFVWAATGGEIRARAGPRRIRPPTSGPSRARARASRR